MDDNKKQQPQAHDQVKKEHNANCSCQGCLAKEGKDGQKKYGKEEEAHKGHMKKPGCCD